MAEAPLSLSSAESSPENFFTPTETSAQLHESDKDTFHTLDENSVPLDDSPQEVEQQISESLDQLSTKSNSDSESDEKIRKKARVGNHYQARIPKFIGGLSESSEDELLWDPFILDSDVVEAFLSKIANLTKFLLPMGSHLRDDEEALYVLQKNSHDVDSAFKTVSEGKTEKNSVWTEEECRNFERGLLNFGKNFFLIQKYRVTTRKIGELVQFYYLWKKTERYDLFASRMRGSKKKYNLNPGMSDLMCRFLGTQTSDVQFIVTDARKHSSQY